MDWYEGLTLSKISSLLITMGNIFLALAEEGIAINVFGKL